MKYEVSYHKGEGCTVKRVIDVDPIGNVILIDENDRNIRRFNNVGAAMKWIDDERLDFEAELLRTY